MREKPSQGMNFEDPAEERGGSQTDTRAINHNNMTEIQIAHVRQIEYYKSVYVFTSEKGDCVYETGTAI
nr:hypothetical protein [Lachnoclostridium phocaeense]